MINFRKDKSGLSIINIIGCCMFLLADDSKSSGTIMVSTPLFYGYVIYIVTEHICKCL